MALTCELPNQVTNVPSFIDCQSINVSYQINGLANVSFTVVSSSKTINLGNYTTVIIGSNRETRRASSFTAGRVRYKGVITSYEISPIQGTLVYEHRLQLLAFGCRV